MNEQNSCGLLPLDSLKKKYFKSPVTYKLPVPRRTDSERDAWGRDSPAPHVHTSCVQGRRQDPVLQRIEKSQI